MGENDSRRDDSPADEQRPADSLVNALRDLPKMRSIPDTRKDGKPYIPPPPTISRFGGMAQGCGGFLLIVVGVVMVMAAVRYGFFLWGPMLLLGGGMLLTGGTLGVWRGRRTQVILSLAALAGIAIVAYFWYSFINVAGWLSPFSGIGMIFVLISELVILVLGATLLLNLLSLIYWKRLVAFSSRGLTAWGVLVAVLVVTSVGLHFFLQNQRETWLQDHFDTWSAEAATGEVTIGWNANVTLGYSFLTENEDDESPFDLRTAELEAALDGGADIVRVTASGDTVWEAELARLFEAEEDDAEAQQEAVARLQRQARDEESYMALLAGSDTHLLLADAQYSPYLLAWAAESDGDKLPWAQFAESQQDRIRHFAGLYQPYAYEVATEPDAYFEFSAIEQPEDAGTQWIAQIEALVAAVEEESPETLTGVTISLAGDFDQDLYPRLLEIDGLDFIGVRIFQPAGFEVLDDLIAEHGDPAQADKQLWIVETWYGYCLAPQRSMKLDALWLDTAVAYAARQPGGVVLMNDYGCFLREGGTLFQVDTDEDGRTPVWKRWRDLIQTW